MLYAVSYEKKTATRREEAAYQRELSRRLLSYAMRREYGTPRLPELRKTPEGKPCFINHPAKFSLTHCSGLVCCALSEEEIGVDAEPLDRPFEESAVLRVCTPQELEAVNAAPDRKMAFLTLWTLKESLMKLTGKGISLGFQNAAFLLKENGFVPAAFQAQSFSFFEVSGYVISVCAAGKLPERVITIKESAVF